MDFTADLPQLLSDIHNRLLDPDRLPLAVSALLLAGIVGYAAGPLRGNAQPLLWHIIDRLFGRAGDKLGKAHRSRADLIFRGFLLTGLALLVALAAGRTAELLTVMVPAYAVTEILLLTLCLSAGAVWKAVARLYTVLDKPGSEKGAYYAIAQTSRINLNSTDNFGITRAGMGLAARSFDKAALAPAFWYAVGGLPFVFATSAISALAWRFGKDGFSKGFGETAMAFDRILGFVPTLMAGVFLSIASIVTPSAGIGRSVAAWFAVRHAAPYAQGGLPLSVMAYALNVSLGGPVQDLNGSTLKSAWVGPDKASAKVDHNQLRRGLYIVIVAHVFWVAALLGCYVWAYRMGSYNILPGLVP